LPWVAEAHGHNGDAAHIVKLLGPEREPPSQAISRGIREGNARGVHAHTGRLAADANGRACTRPQHRPRLVRQWRALRRVPADAAGFDFTYAGGLPGHALAPPPDTALMDS